MDVVLKILSVVESEVAKVMIDRMCFSRSNFLCFFLLHFFFFFYFSRFFSLSSVSSLSSLFFPSFSFFSIFSFYLSL